MAEEENRVVESPADAPLSPYWFAAGSVLGGLGLGSLGQTSMMFPMLLAGGVLEPDVDAAGVNSQGRPDQTTTSRLVEP